MDACPGPLLPRFSMLRDDAYRRGIIVFLIVLISLAHYRTREDLLYLHVIYREMYFLPVVLAGFWFGLRGGLLASLTVTCAYLPFVFLSADRFTGHEFGNLLEIMLYFAVGLLVGWMRDQEVRRQEEQRQMASLAAMGKGISCIAHDMKTPLTAIGGFARQLRRRTPDGDSDAVKKLDIIIGQADRLELMIMDMLAFARPLQLDRRRGDLNDLVRQTVEVAAGPASAAGIRIELDLDERLPSLLFDRNRLQQALLNLIGNGVEASAAGSRVVVRSRLHAGEDRVVVEVLDRGRGVDEQEMDRICTPFMTTKKNGTGLGLAIVSKIVQAHGGRLRYRSRDNGGMLFTIVLPWGGEGKPDASSAPAPAVGTGPREDRDA